MGRRVKKLTLPCKDFNAIAAQSGGVSNSELSIYFRGATGVEDVSVIDVTRDGEAVKVFVESSTFPELSCCYKANAPEWTHVTLGEQRG